MNDEQMYDILQECIAKTVGIDRGKITPDTSLIDDLGADSLDLLDLVFRLEQAFHIRISRGDIERRAKAALPGSDFEQDGLLTAVGKEALRQALPEVAPERFAAIARANDIPRLFTVRTFQRLVREQMEANHVT